ncbi:hypothetical protein GCM10009862_31550 [Microbacterium binotii]|uniref:Uncharacterized protein n=1 Tax=Microbacterium binotii TaxID=462710 RepID=A0ABN3PNA3_9MICO
MRDRIQELVGERRRRIDEVLTVVEHDQSRCLGEDVGEEIERISGRMFTEQQGASDGEGHAPRILETVESDEPGDHRGRGRELVGGALGQTRLADPAHAGERHEAAGAQQRADRVELGPAAHELAARFGDHPDPFVCTDYASP